MGWNNLVVVSHALHNVVKAYVSVVKYIATFVDPTPPTNIIENETTLKQYSINRGSNIVLKGKATVQK